MPIYEYECPQCHAKFEELVRSEAAASRVVCYQCGHQRVQRQFSVFSAHAAPTRSSSRPPGGCGGCGAAGTCPMAGE